MNQETKSLLAVGLSVLVFVLWFQFFAPKKPPAKTPSPLVGEGKGEGEINYGSHPPLNPLPSREGKPGVSAQKDPQAHLETKTTLIESDIFRVELTNDGGLPISWQMKKFKKNSGEEDGFVDLISGEAAPLRESLAGMPERAKYRLEEVTGEHVVFSWRSNKLAVTKTYRFDPEDYLVDISYKVKNLAKAPLTGSLSLGWESVLPKEEKKGLLGFLRGPANEFQPVYFLDNKAARSPVVSKEGRLLWGGVEDRYFISAIIPRGHGETAKISSKKEVAGDGRREVLADITIPAMTVLPGAEEVRHFSIYVGPKEMTNLKSVGVSLEKAIDYGWFSFIAVPILYIMKFFYGLLPNYGVAILLLTILVKLILNPLSRHSLKSMKKMQVLQPKLKELKEKYKNDRERMNMETMALFRAHKVNPMGGCLPMLLQLPIYIALYKVLWNSIELYRAPFFWFYNDLSTPDPFFIMPVLLGVTMWLQQRMTPTASADPTQAKMMQIMPIMFTAFMLFLPSGLVFYILVNTVMGVAQQYMMNKDIRLRDLIRGRIKQPAKA